MPRPMANVFAVGDSAPGALDDLQARLSDSGEFAEVWSPAPGWIAAVAPLPDADHDPEPVRAAGLVFAEGRNRLDSGDDLSWIGRVTELVDRTPARLSELEGDFGFLRFRPDGSAVAVRSCAGVAPFYLHRRMGGGLAVGTRLCYFPRFLDEHFRADPLINATWYSTEMFIDGRPFVEGVSILPRASHVELAPGREPRQATYWDPRPAAGTALRPDPDHPRELRILLISALVWWMLRDAERRAARR